MNDQEIVELYLSRNEDAINQTAQKYGPRLRNIANRIVNNEETAKECENDTYLEAWNLIPPHEPRDYLFAFVGRIVRHVALNVCKREGRQKRFALYCELTEEMQECLPAENDTEAEVEAGYLSGLINSFLETRSDEQQDIFVRRYWYYDPVNEICARYGFGKSKVTVSLKRTRDKLSHYLKEEGYNL